MPKKQVEVPYPKEVIEHLLGLLHADIARAELWLMANAQSDHAVVREQLRLLKAMQNFVMERSLV